MYFRLDSSLLENAESVRRCAKHSVCVMIGWRHVRATPYKFQRQRQAPCGVSRLFWRVSFSRYLFANNTLSHHVYEHSTPRRRIGAMDKKPHKISNRRFSPFCRLIQEKTHPKYILCEQFISLRVSVNTPSSP